MSFIETSALDCSNVETAFQTVLTGNSGISILTNNKFPSLFYIYLFSTPSSISNLGLFFLHEKCIIILSPEIYSLVSQKDLRDNSGGFNLIDDIQTFEVTQNGKEEEGKKKCCVIM